MRVLPGEDKTSEHLLDPVEERNTASALLHEGSQVQMSEMLLTSSPRETNSIQKPAPCIFLTISRTFFSTKLNLHKRPTAELVQLPNKQFPVFNYTISKSFKYPFQF